MTTRPTNLRELEMLSYQEKIRHWDGEDPWNPQDGQYRFLNPKLPPFRVSMVDGHITSMPVLIGRPCFGIATAYLRYRSATKYVPKRGNQPASRCADCRVKLPCKDVVNRRIKSSTALTMAYHDWQKADGPTEIIIPGNWRDSASGSKWRQFCRIAANTNFTSSNDDLVAAFYTEKDRLAREQDLLRKRRSREAARRGGDLDEAHAEDLKMAMKHRAAILVQAINKAKTIDNPRTLSRLPNQSLIDLLNVWLGREFLKARRQPTTAAAIGRWLLQNERCDRSAKLDALSTRVSKDLKRIMDFEQMRWNGGALLPPFDADSEIRK